MSSKRCCIVVATLVPALFRGFLAPMRFLFLFPHLIVSLSSFHARCRCRSSFQCLQMQVCKRLARTEQVDPLYFTWFGSFYFFRFFVSLISVPLRRFFFFFFLGKLPPFFVWH